MTTEIDVAVLKTRQDRTDTDVRELKGEMHDEFLRVHGKLDTLIASQNRNKGASTVLMMIISAIGGLLALAGEWAVSHFK